MFAQVYNCSRCGDVDGRVIQIIDTERDEVWSEVVCDQCNGIVSGKTDDKGNPVWRELTEEEILAENGFYDENHT